MPSYVKGVLGRFENCAVQAELLQLSLGWKTLGYLIYTLWYLATLLLKVELEGLPNVLAPALQSPPGQLFRLDGSRGSFLVPDYSPPKS